MGINLTKEEALSKIKSIVEVHTKDYELFLYKRITKDIKTKTLIFALKVKAETFCEQLFDEFMNLKIQAFGIEVVESEMVNENKTNKDIFLLKVDVDVFETN